MDAIGRENWSYCWYVLGSNCVFISYGGEVSKSGDVVEVYYVSSCEIEGLRTKFQKSFLELDQAIEYINNQYSHFTFQDRRELESGCASCSK